MLESHFGILLSITTLGWMGGGSAFSALVGGANNLREPFCVLGLIAAFENIRNYSLVLGLGGIAGGVLLFINHKKHLEKMLASDAAERVKVYESRKYRRRATASAMIASVGCMLAALYWVNDARVFSVFILMILGLLVGILGVALIDLFSVGLQQIATPDDQSRKAMIEEFLRQREEAGTDEGNEKK